MTFRKIITLTCLLLATALVQGQTYTVTSTANAGSGTLRDALTQAILVANTGGIAEVVLDAPGYCQITSALPKLEISDGIINIKKSSTTSVLQGIQYLGSASDNLYYYGLYIAYQTPSGTTVYQQPSVNIDGVNFVDFQCHSTGLNTFPIYSEVILNCEIQNCEFINDQSLTSIYFGVKDVFQSAYLNIHHNTIQKNNFQYGIYVGAPIGFSVHPVVYHSDPNLDEGLSYYDRIAIEMNTLNNTGTNIYSFPFSHGAITVEKLFNYTYTRIKANTIQNFDKGIVVTSELLDIPNGIGYSVGSSFLLQSNSISNCNTGMELYNPQAFFNMGGNNLSNNSTEIVLNTTANGKNPAYNGYNYNILLNGENFLSHTSLFPGILVSGFTTAQLNNMIIKGSVVVDGADARAKVFSDLILGGVPNMPITLNNNSNNQISSPSLYAVQFDSPGFATAVFTLNSNYHSGSRRVDFYLSNSNGDLQALVGTKTVIGPVVNARASLSNTGLAPGARIAAIVHAPDVTSEAAYINIVDNVCCKGVLFSVATGENVKAIDFEEGVSAVVCQTGEILFTPDVALCNESPLTFTWDFGDGTPLQVYSSSQQAPHVFAAPGIYYVTLSVGGTGCNSNVFTAMIYVIDCCCSNMNITQYYSGSETYNYYTAVAGTVIPVTVSEGQTVGLNAYSTCNYGLPVMNIAVPVWNFGDGSAPVTGLNVTHAYATAGNYNITYTINQPNCDDCCPPQNLNVSASHGLRSSSVATPGSNSGSNSNNFYCTTEPVVFNVGPFCQESAEASDFSGYVFNWNFGDGGSSSSATPFHVYTAAGTYTVTVSVSHEGCETEGAGTFVITIIDCGTAPPCEVCIGSFAPIQGEKYVLSAWIKQDLTDLEIVTYTGANITLAFTGGGVLGPFYGKGSIIDGWQKIEEEFIVPPSASDIEVRLNNSSVAGGAYFDDIRIHPFNSNLKSFVYDAINLRLMAELDQNNYATYYEYDEEGKLVRIKKETERGVKTIKESINNTSKK